MEYITLSALAKELHWGKPRLEKYLLYHAGLFDLMDRTFNGWERVNKNVFYEIKKQIEMKEDAINTNFIADIVKSPKNDYYNDAEKLKRKRILCGISTGSNGRTVCENVLRKGKAYCGFNGVCNPPKFSNFNGDLYKAS